MPAARQRSRSPFIACAVIAMIGTCRAACSPRARGSRRSPRSRPSPASARPSAPGRTAGRVDARRAPRGRCRRPSRCGRASRAGRGQPLVDHVVLGEQDVQAPRRQLRPGASTAGSTARCPGSRASDAADRVEQVALLDRLGQVARRCRARGSAVALVVLPGRGEHHDRRAAEVGGRADSPRHLEAVHLRHVGVEQHERERLPAGAAPRPARRAPRRRCRRRSGVIRQRSSRSCEDAAVDARCRRRSAPASR